MAKREAKKNLKSLNIDAKVTKGGLTVIVNGKEFSITYPREIWQKYPAKAKEALKDNAAYSSTIFLPQMFDLTKIYYQTARPLSETFLFKNGIYDMPCCAIADEKSSLGYVKKFFNTQYIFADNKIKTARNNFHKKTMPAAIIPFSFGKESLLSAALCREIGIKPILVNFIEPANEFEYFHKKKLIKKFEAETGLKVYTIEYGPGILRYGKYWNLETELGWGLQTTEYSMLSVPLADYFKTDYIILGNEQSCNDVFFNKEGVLTYKAGYDQHGDWTPQQGLLASLIAGRKIEVISFMEPLYEIAITKILHGRYPEYGKYQMSCMADNEKAKTNRWCQYCVKCGYIFALGSAFNIDLKKIGFTENLFDREHASVYEHFFKYDPQAPAYGSEEELGLAFYLACLKGRSGYSIDLFKKTKLKKFERNQKKLIKKYLGITPGWILPNGLTKKILKIYQQELSRL